MGGNGDACDWSLAHVAINLTARWKNTRKKQSKTARNVTVINPEKAEAARVGIIICRAKNGSLNKISSPESHQTHCCSMLDGKRFPAASFEPGPQQSIPPNARNVSREVVQKKERHASSNTLYDSATWVTGNDTVTVPGVGVTAAFPKAAKGLVSRSFATSHSRNR